MNIRKWFTLQILYIKRLFRKKTFIVLLCIVPLMVLGLRLIANEDNGILNVILCMEDERDELASKTVEKLLESDSLIAYEFCENEEEAMARLESGEVDAVWVFPEDMRELIKEYASGATSTQLVRIYEIEDTTSLRLSREALMASFFDEIAYEEYAGYVVGAVPEGAEVTEEEIRAYYDYFKQDGSLFEYYSIDGSEWERPDSYLTAPVRGMLALLILLAGIAGVMYFRQDKEAGVYDYLPPSEEWIYRFSSQMVAMIVVGIVVIISLYVSGNGVSFPVELLLMVTYIVACALFCSLLERILGNLLLMGIITPFIILITFVLCPVFFLINGFIPVRNALPTY